MLVSFFSFTFSYDEEFLHDDQKTNQEMSDILKNKLDDNDEDSRISFPSNIEQLKRLARILSLYSQTHSQYVFILFCSAYIFKQTFAIPGSVFLVSLK